MHRQQIPVVTEVGAAIKVLKAEGASSYERRALARSVQSAARPDGTIAESAYTLSCSSETLRKHVLLHAGVEHPQHRIEYRTPRNRLATRMIIQLVLLRKMFPNPLPVLIVQTPHVVIVKAT